MAGNLLHVLALAGILVSLVAMPVGAVPGPGSNECEVNRHHINAAIAGVIAGGDHEAQANVPGCGIARSNTQVFQWAGQYSGPAAVVAVVQTWSALSFTGCTLGTITQSNLANAGGTSNFAIADLTMTSNECRGRIRFTLTATAAFTWEAIFHVNIRVEEPNLTFLCGATEATVNAYTPAQTCMEPQLNNLNYLCAATGGVPDAFSESTTTCSTPILTLNGVPDTQEELQAIADAIAAGFTVQFGNASFGNMTVPTTIRVESSTAETALPLLLLLAAFIFAGYRLLQKPWRWLWVIGILTIGFFVYIFNEEKLSLTAVVAFLGGLWIIVLLLNKFGFGAKPEET